MARKRGVTEFLKAFEDVGTTFFDLETDLLIVLNEQGNVERINPAFEKALGYTEAEVLGQGIIRLVKMEDWASFLRDFTSTQPAPFRLLRKGQGEVTVRLIAVRFKQQHGFMVLRKVQV